jgi:ketosteroid isomerase-like protein
MDSAEVVREAFDAYLSGDRTRAEALYAPAFTFTSPQDDHIDRSAYFERCFPTAGRFRSLRLLHVTAAGPRDVHVVYEYELTSGETYRNAELVTVDDGVIVEAQVFFGGRYDGGRA